MASCSKLLLVKVLFLQANGQQTTVSVKPWNPYGLRTKSLEQQYNQGFRLRLEAGCNIQSFDM